MGSLMPQKNNIWNIKAARYHRRRKRPRQGFGTAPRSAPPVFHRQLGQLSD